MIKSIAHICISTKDLDETERFYCFCLGLTKKFNFIRNDNIAGYYLQINENNYIEVFHRDTLSSDEDPKIKHFCLEVEDIDKAIENIKKYDVDVTDKKIGCDNSWQAWLTDPNGIKIELHEYTDKSCQVTGSDCFINF